MTNDEDYELEYYEEYLDYDCCYCGTCYCNIDDDGRHFDPHTGDETYFTARNKKAVIITTDEQ
jgi:hypothetical protein